MGETAKRYNSILDIIKTRLLPDDIAKKIRGEVFTPLNLVREMLFGIRKSSFEKFKNNMPNIRTDEYLKLIWGVDDKGEFIEDDEADRIGGIPLDIWRNPETKWLDPANGIGNFPVVAFYMLDYQLGKHGPKEFKGDDNKLKRRRHIVKNMLFMIELNKGNVNTSRKIFEKIVPGVTANICCTDTLKMTNDKLIEEFRVNKFDVVMGNPPFNDSLEKNPLGHAQDTGLWEKFVRYSINNLLKPDTGLLTFLHPARWRQPGHSLHDLMFSSQLIFLAIFDKKKGKEAFNAITRFDYYILQNKKASNNTQVKFQDNILINIKINEKSPFISNFGYDIWDNIINSGIKNLEVLGGKSIKYTNSDRAINDNCPSSKPYLYVNTTAKTEKVKGNKYKKTRKNSNSSSIYVDIICSSVAPYPDITGQKKVIFSKNEVVYSFYDNGKYALASNAFYIPVDNKDQGELLVKYLNSKLIKYLIASVKFGNFSTAKNIFDYIPNPLLMKGAYSEKNIYEKLTLTPLQIERIHNEKIEEESEEEPTEGGSRKPHRFTRRKSRQ